MDVVPSVELSLVLLVSFGRSFEVVSALTAAVNVLVVVFVFVIVVVVLPLLVAVAWIAVPFVHSVLDSTHLGVPVLDVVPVLDELVHHLVLEVGVLVFGAVEVS